MEQLRNKLYIVVAEWSNTKDNHAGMLHLARQIAASDPARVKVIRIPTKWLYGLFWLYRLYIDLIALWLSLKVRRGDTVWLMEYLLRTVQQSDAARILKGRCNVIATAHLVPGRLDRHYSPRNLLSKITPLDRLYVLGNSLRDYFISKGVSPDKVKTTFHYVDTDYYTPSPHRSSGSRLKAIAMGNMERDFESLRRIVELAPDVEFTICLGMKKTDMFDSYPNVRTKGFVSEDELRSLMQQSDVSVNAIYDTIGSNVITTSLACGLPVLATRVGSIADYITHEHNGYLFDTPEECAAQLRKLASDPDLCRSVSQNACQTAQSISVVAFIDTLNHDLNSMTAQ